MTSMNAEVMALICKRALHLEDDSPMHGLINAQEIDKIGRAWNILNITLMPYYYGGCERDRTAINYWLNRYYSLSEEDETREEYERTLMNTNRWLVKFFS